MSLATQPRARRMWAGPALVVGVALLACLGGIGNQFAQDDVVLIAENARVHQLGGLLGFFTTPFWPPPYSPDLYRPLTSVLLALQYGLGGGAPLIFRLVSYALYAAVSLALLQLGRRLLPVGVALGIALLFAAHPLHVEAVALGVSQNELLVTLLAVGMVLGYLRLRQRGAGALRVRDWVLLGVLYLSASLLKENGLVLPALLLAAELLLVPQREPRRSWRSLAPGYGLLAALGGAVLLVRSLVFPGRLSGTFVADQLRGAGFFDRALTMLHVVPHWFRLLLWPAHLQADFSPQELVASRGIGPVEILGLTLLAGFGVLFWLVRRRAPVAAFGLAWTAIALLPVSNVLVPTGILLAERTLLLASAGFLLALGGLLSALPAGALRAGRWRIGLATCCGVLVLVGILRSWSRQRTWRDDSMYAIQSAQDAPESWRAQKAAGYALFQQDRSVEAMSAYQKALLLAPPEDVWQVHNDLARRWFEAQEDSLAVAELRKSLRASPEQTETRNYLVLGLLGMGHYAEAAAQADSALQRGGSVELFGGLRALADSAARVGAPPGSIRVRVVTGGRADGRTGGR